MAKKTKKKANEGVKPDSSTLFGKLADLASIRLTKNDTVQGVMEKIVTILDDDEVVTNEVWDSLEEPVQNWINVATTAFNDGKPIAAPDGLREALIEAGAGGESAQNTKSSGRVTKTITKKTPSKMPTQTDLDPNAPKRQPQKGSGLKRSKFGVGSGSYRATQIFLERGQKISDADVIAQLGKEGMNYAMSNIPSVRSYLRLVSHALLHDKRGPKAAAEAIVSELGGEV